MGPPLPPQRPLLNCSSELSCLGLQINREAINLSSSSPALSKEEQRECWGKTQLCSLLQDLFSRVAYLHPIPTPSDRGRTRVDVQGGFFVAPLPCSAWQSLGLLGMRGVSQSPRVLKNQRRMAGASSLWKGDQHL